MGNVLDDLGISFDEIGVKGTEDGKECKPCRRIDRSRFIRIADGVVFRDIHYLFRVCELEEKFRKMINCEDVSLNIKTYNPGPHKASAVIGMKSECKFEKRPGELFEFVNIKLLVEVVSMTIELYRKLQENKALIKQKLDKEISSPSIGDDADFTDEVMRKGCDDLERIFDLKTQFTLDVVNSLNNESKTVKLDIPDSFDWIELQNMSYGVIDQSAR